MNNASKILATLVCAFTASCYQMIDEAERPTSQRDGGVSVSGEPAPPGPPLDETYTPLFGPYAENTTCLKSAGIDLLLVIDNSPSMWAHSSFVSTRLVTLLNELVAPYYLEPDQLPPRDIRVAVISGDQGLSTRDGASPRISPIGECRDRGDAGRFRTTTADAVSLQNNVIRCNPDGSQCLDGELECGEDGRCFLYTPQVDIRLACGDSTSRAAWMQTEVRSRPRGWVKDIVCTTPVSTTGCFLQQPFSSILGALSAPDQGAFIHPDHVLAVVVVSNGDDCSIEHRELFETVNWQPWTFDDESSMQVCRTTMPSGNHYLTPAALVRDRLIQLKGGDPALVFFAAIAGVPGERDSPCRRNGDLIGECLRHPAMSEALDTIACSRDIQGIAASPGRRFVELAELFGPMGYIHPYCLDDWGHPLEELLEQMWHGCAL